MVDKIERAAENIVSGGDVEKEVGTLAEIEDVIEKPTSLSENTLDTGVLFDSPMSLADDVLTGEDNLLGQLADQKLREVNTALRTIESNTKLQAEEYFGVKVKSNKSIEEMTPLERALELKDRRDRSINQRLISSVGDRGTEDIYNLDPREMFSFIGGSPYSRYPFYTPGIDNEHHYAMRQSTGEKLGRGGIKFLSGVATSFTGSTIGVIDGLFNAIKEGDLSAMSSGSVNTWLNEIDQIIDIKKAHYYKTGEHENNFLQKLGTANFWTGELTPGIAYIVGSLAAEGAWAMLTGGTSLTTTAMRIGNRANNIRKFLNMGDTSRKMIRNATKTANLERLNYAGRFGKFINTNRYILTTAGYDAASETLMFKQRAMEEFYQYYRETGEEVDPQLLSEIMEEVEGSARKVYYTNLAVVGTTSLALYGPLFNIRNPLKKVWNETGDRVFRRGGYYNRETGKTVAREATNFHRTSDFIYSNLVRPAAYQGGWEAAQQHNIRETAAEWVQAGYNEEYTRDQKSLFNAFLDKAGETYTTKEGWNSIGTGMFIGMFGRLTSIGTPSRRSQMDAYFKGMQNSYTAEKFIDGVKAMNRVRYGNELYTEAAEANNATGMLHAENSQMTSIMDYHAKHGQLDQFISDVEFALNQTETSTLAEMMGVEQAQANQAKNEFIGRVKRTSKELKIAREFAESFIGRGKLPKQLEGAGRGELISSIAMVITMNNLTEKDIAKPFNIIKTLFEGLDAQNAKRLGEALEAHTIFSKATKTQQQQLSLLKSEHTRVKEELQKVEKELEGAGSFENQVDTNRLIGLNRKLESLTNELKDIETQAAVLESEIVKKDSQGPYEDGREGVKTSSLREHLDLYKSTEVIVDGEKTNRLEALEPLKEYAESIKDSNPSKYEALNMGLVELERSILAHKYYNDLVLGMRSGDFNLKSFATKLGFRMFGNKPVDTYTEQLIMGAWAEGAAIRGHARNMAGQVVFAPQLSTRNVDLKNMTNEELEELRAEIIEELDAAREAGDTDFITNLENDNDALANYIAERESQDTTEITRELVRSLNTLEKEFQREIKEIEETDFNKRNNESIEQRIEEAQTRFEKQRKDLIKEAEEAASFPQEKSKQFQKEIEEIQKTIEELETQRETERNKETRLIQKDSKITIFGMQLTPSKSKVTDTTIDFLPETGTIKVNVLDAEGNVVSEIVGTDLDTIIARANIEIESQTEKTKIQKEGQKKRLRNNLKKFLNDFTLQDPSSEISGLGKRLSNERAKLESRQFQLKKMEEFTKNLSFLSLSTTEPFKAVVERLRSTEMASEVVMMDSKSMREFLKKEGFTEEESSLITNAIEVKKSIDSLEQKPFKTKKGVSLNTYGNIGSMLDSALDVEGYSLYQSTAIRLRAVLEGAETKEVKLTNREMANFKNGRTVNKIEGSIGAQVIKILNSKGEVVNYLINDNAITQEITDFKEGSERTLQDKNLFSRARVRVVPNGFAYQGKVFLNSDTATITTALHGFAHIYNQNLKETNPELYERGMELIREELALGKDSSIIDIIEFVRLNQPGITGEALHQEVMAELTGRRGTEILKGREKEGSSIIQWIKDAFNSIKEMLGLSRMTTEEAMGLNVNEYAEAIATDLLTGDALFTELTTDRAVAELLRKRTPSEMEKGLRALTMEQADRAMANIFKENPNIRFQDVLNIINTREITQWFNWNNTIEGADYWTEVDFNVRQAMLGEGNLTSEGVNKLANAYMKMNDTQISQRVDGTRGDETDTLIAKSRKALDELAKLEDAHNKEVSELESQIKDNDSPETRAKREYMLREAKERYEINKEKVRKGERTGIETVDIVMALESFLFNNQELRKYLPETYVDGQEGADKVRAEEAMERVTQDLTEKIEEFSELIAKGLQGEELTEVEKSRYRALEEDLAQVNILKGITLDIGPVDMDLAGLVELYNQMMYQPEDSSTHVTEVNSVEETNRSQSSRYNMVSAAQFPEGVWVKLNTNGMYEVSQMPLTTITDNLEVSLVGQEISLDGGITFQTVDGDNIVNATKKGAIINITLEGGAKINIEVGEHGRLILSQESYTTLMDSIGAVEIVSERNRLKGSHYAVYKKNGEGEIMTPLENTIEFAEGDNLPIANNKEAFAADRVTFKVSTENAYNKRLIEDLNNAKTKKAKEEAMDAIRRETVIYIMTENGKVLGVLRAGDSNNGYLKSKNFAAIRIQASEIMVDSKGAGMIRDIRDSEGKVASVRVSRKYQGDPIVNLVQEGDSYTRELRDINMEEESAIIDFGYVQNGEMVLKEGTKISYMVDYLPDNARKTPIVVVDYGGQKVPLTVTAKPDTYQIAGTLNEIFNSEASDQEKTLAVNRALMDKDLAPKNFTDLFRRGLLHDPNLQETMIAQIEAQSPEVNIDVWMKGQSLGTVGKSIMTDKSLTEFRRSKVILGFTGMKGLPTEHLAEAAELSKQVKVDKKTKEKVDNDNSTKCKG